MTVTAGHVSLADGGTAADPETLASAIADALVASAISDGRRATWLAPVVEADGPRRRVTLQTGDPTLYQGTAGIAWACAEAATILGRDDLARVAIEGARSAVAAARPEQGIGLYDGLTGTGLTALAVGTRLAEPDIASEGRRLLDDAASAVASGPELVRGAAGVVVGLLAADRIDHGRRWQPGAIRHGAALVAQGERRSWGWAWPLPGMEEPALCGLAHGAAGIAWALGELRAAADEALSADEDEALAAGVEGALRFERSWFDYRRNTWPDLRSGLVEPGALTPHPSLWCHGSVGIGLTRLRLYQLSRDTALLAEAAAALQSSVDAADAARSPATTSFGLTLCHGLGGTLALLLAAGDVLGEDEHRVTARWLFEQATLRLGADVDQWPSGVEGCAWAPGLMTGLAGSMLVFLRLADPGAVAGNGTLLADVGAA